MLNAKTSLGIDISESTISFALIRQSKDRTRLVKAGSATIPEGLMESGNIVHPVKLGRCLHKLLHKNGIRKSTASVSLVANPSLIQIIDLPDEMPSNVAQFVQSEIKYSAIVAGKQHQYNYHGLGVGGPNDVSRLMVAAADDKKLSALLTALAVARIEPISIEPVMIAWMRALYDNYMMTNYDGNVLLAKADRFSMTVCVFRKGLLDFIRNTEMPIVADNAEYLSVFHSKLNSVRQFYDVEIAPCEDDKWHTIVEIDPAAAEFDEISELFASGLGDFHICSPQQVDSQISLSTAKSIESASIAAVGLALGKYEETKMKISLDLIPEIAINVKAAKKLTFAAVSIIAVVLNVILICNNLVGAQSSKTDTLVENAKESLMTGEISQMIEQKIQIEQQLADLTDRTNFMTAALAQDTPLDWPGIFETLIEKSSQNICITSLRQLGDQTMIVQGKVTLHKSAHDFAAALTQSSYFKSAVISEMTQDSSFEGAIEYTMDCIMNNHGGENGQ